MKQYFTKYLPVEGEIKEGDIVTCMGYTGIYTSFEFGKGFRLQFPNGKANLFPEDELSEEDYKHQKVKLFLCSRDNSEYAQEILTEGIKEGQEFTEFEKDLLTLGSVVEIYLAD